MVKGRDIKKVVILGDSTLDNRIWLGFEKLQLILNSIFKPHKRLVGLFRFLRRFNPFKPKSVVESLKQQLPGVVFIDRANDGFTTKDVLRGAYKDKVFGQGAHDLFPHEFFKPLDSRDIDDASQIILSVGGNNFREFILDVSGCPDLINQARYQNVFDTMLRQYKDILQNLTVRNPNAHLVLMTQYYPALNQKMLVNVDIYDFMETLGKALGFGSAEDTIVKVMQDTYSQVLQFIATAPCFKDRHVSVVDVTSSLNPNHSELYTGQIEPSHKGGQRIAKMLDYALMETKQPGKNIYRFLPKFFTNTDSNEFVISSEITPNVIFSPVHPKKMAKPPKLSFNQKMGAVTMTALAFVGSYFFSGVNLVLSGLAAVVGGLLGKKIAYKLNDSASINNNEVYQFDYATKPTDMTDICIKQNGFVPQLSQSLSVENKDMIPDISSKAKPTHQNIKKQH